MKPKDCHEALDNLFLESNRSTECANESKRVSKQEWPRILGYKNSVRDVYYQADGAPIAIFYPQAIGHTSEENKA